MSIGGIKNRTLRRLVLVVAFPILLPLNMILGALTFGSECFVVALQVWRQKGVP